MTILLAIAAGFLISWFNGANDVSKGIATLVGSGVTDYKRAILWGTICTGAGALAGGVFGGAMVATFGKGLLGPGVTPTFAAALATILGAAAWVIIATRTGLPVSTTHAIVGSIAGVAVLAYGPAGFAWAALTQKVALPLLLSPAAALAATGLLLAISARLLPIPAPGCICAKVEAPVLVSADGGTAQCPVHLTVIAAPVADCPPEELPLRFTPTSALHWVSSGATSFARGMNDAPKIAALVLAASALGVSLGPTPVFVSVALGMVLGSFIAGLRITTVLAEGVTRMNHREGFLANLVTSVLVASGAWLGWPMSTTHVSTGAIVGAGTARSAGEVRWGKVAGLGAAWVITLPAAALLGGALYGLLHLTGI